MFKIVMTIIALAVSLCLSAFSETGESLGDNLQRAEEEMGKTLAQLDAKLGSQQKEKLNSSQKAWGKYRDATVALFQDGRRGPYAKRDDCMKLFASIMTWQRVARLQRMTTCPSLRGDEAGFSLADKELNSRYKEYREAWSNCHSDSIVNCDILNLIKTSELAWIKYRDGAAVSEASLYTDTADMVSWCVKTELSWERVGFLRDHWLSVGVGDKLLTSPPSLKTEMLLEQMQADDENTATIAINAIAENEDSIFPVLLEHIKRCSPLFNSYPSHAYPLFKKLGLHVAPLLIEILNSNPKCDLSPFFSAMGPQIIPALVESAENGDEFTRKIVITTLHSFGRNSVEAVPFLVSELERPQPCNLTVLLETLEFIGEPAKPEMSKLISLISENKSIPAAKAACRIDPKDSELGKAIAHLYIEKQNSNSDSDMSYLEDFLVKTGVQSEEIIPILIKRSCGNMGLFNMRASYSLRSLVSKADITWLPELIKALKDPETENLPPLYDALVNIGESSMPALLQLLDNTSDLAIVRRVIPVFPRIKGAASGIIPILLQYAKREDELTSVTALQAIGSYGKIAESAVPELFEIYYKQSGNIGMAAIEALHSIVPDSPKVIEIYPEPPYVMDPIYSFRKLYEGQDSFLSDLDIQSYTSDFNNDGKEDVAVTNQRECGTGGCVYSLYLNVGNGKYKEIGSIGFIMDTLYKQKSVTGVGYLVAYWHIAQNKGGETLYKITMDGVETLGARDVTLDEKGNSIPVKKGDTLPLPDDCVPVER